MSLCKKVFDPPLQCLDSAECARELLYNGSFSYVTCPQVAHYTFDAILISTILAGIRRSTGLS